MNSDLADKIVELDDLNNNKIPAAQAKVQQANSDAAAAKSEADAAAERLKAAEKDKADLEAKIKQTGEDYDDAHAAVAQSARESMHGSDTSDVMSVMTGSKDTKDFIKSMQSRDALARNEANAASDAAVDLNTSMNRADRLKAIEKQCRAVQERRQIRSPPPHSPPQRRPSRRNPASTNCVQPVRAHEPTLENQKSSLTTQAAQQAAQTVMLQSEIDAKNQQWAAEQAAAAAQVQEPEPQGTVEAPAAAAPQPVRSPADANAVPAGADSASVHAITAVHAPDSGRHPSLYGRPGHIERRLRECIRSRPVHVVGL